MTAPDLQTITITDFRSIRGTLAVPLAAPVVLIHGTNGAGKSTVMSALELALTGSVSGVDPTEQQHLVHRGAKRGQIDLKTDRESVRIDLHGGTLHGTPLLDGSEADFLVERCYLAQRTLGRLLELYESQKDGDESAVTGFVNELLGIDELDALIDGLHPVGHKRRVQRLVPAYTEAERDLEFLYQRERELQDELDRTSAQLDIATGACRDRLTFLEAPRSLMEELPSTEAWLDRQDFETALIDLIGARRELLAVERHVSEMANSTSMLETVDLQAQAEAARAAVQAWRRSHGEPFEELLDQVREHIASIPAAGVANPEEIRIAAMRQVDEELRRTRAVLAADERARSVAVQLDSAIQEAQARVTSIDEDLARSSTAAISEDLGKALATLLPHVHTNDCPVCGRDFAEVSEEPLSTHLASLVSELAGHADLLQSLANARLDALADVRRLQEEQQAVVKRRVDARTKLEMQMAVGRLEGARQRLEDLASGMSAGATLIRRLTEVDRDAALARERSRAAVELLRSVSEHATRLGRPIDSRRPLAASLHELIEHVSSQIAGLEARLEARKAARDALSDVVSSYVTRERLEAELKNIRLSAARLSDAIREMDRRRNVMRDVRAQAEAARHTIVRRVFTSALNRVWQDLFVRLAPDEPFVPAFRIPQSVRGPVVARFETVHRDGRPGGAPATMLSAGNLNTAALTLFLALNLSVERRLPWLFLDDPVQSMDEVHVSQFAALMRTLTKEHGRRFVIAVHERALFEYLALELSPARPSEQLVTVELNRSPEGVTLMSPSFRRYEEDAAFAAA